MNAPTKPYVENPNVTHTVSVRAASPDPRADQSHDIWLDLDVYDRQADDDAKDRMLIDKALVRMEFKRRWNDEQGTLYMEDGEATIEMNVFELEAFTAALALAVSTAKDRDLIPPPAQRTILP